VSPLEGAIAPWLTVSRNLFDLFLYLPIGWMLSLSLAVLVRRIFPHSVVSGRRIWIVPVSLLALEFCLEAVGASFSRAFADLFYPGPDAESQWGFVLMTCPTVWAIAYSMGVIFRAPRKRPQPGTHTQAMRPD